MIGPGRRIPRRASLKIYAMYRVMITLKPDNLAPRLLTSQKRTLLQLADRGSFNLIQTRGLRSHAVQEDSDSTQKRRLRGIEEEVGAESQDSLVSMHSDERD